MVTCKSQCSTRKSQCSLACAIVQAFFTQADEGGVSLHSHLAEVIHKLLLDRPSDALSSFESTSIDVKAKHFVAHEAGLKARTHPASLVL